MDYTIKAHPTKYRGVQFRSRLEARWAAFFDLIGARWEYEPIDLVGWTPDFLVTLPRCKRRGVECSHVNQLYVEVKPGRTINELRSFLGWKADRMMDLDALGDDPAIGLFGLGPAVTWWSSISCSGDSAGGVEGLEYTCRMPERLDRLWDEAGNRTQWRP